jgi:GntR family transcriptional regulator/MocR family aminotransferase
MEGATGWLWQPIRRGQLPPGGFLPSTRELARQLGVSRNTVLEAYAALSAEGCVTGSIGTRCTSIAEGQTATR